MERRTGCLQSNLEFLRQVLVRQRREFQAGLNAASRQAAAHGAEIAALKTALARLRDEPASLKKLKSDKNSATTPIR